MTYSYEPTKIKAQGKDQMRFELGDALTDGGADTCTLADEEYNALLDGLGSAGNSRSSKKAWLFAKLAVLEAILFKLSYQVNTKIDVLSYDLGDRAERWQKLYDQIKKQTLAAASIPTLAPQIANKPPYFYAGMQENLSARHGSLAGQCGEVPPFRNMTE